MSKITESQRRGQRKEKTMTRKEKNERAQYLTEVQKMYIERLELARKELKGRVDAWEAKHGKPSKIDDHKIHGEFVWPSRNEMRAGYLEMATRAVKEAEKENNRARRELENFLRDTPVED